MPERRITKPNLDPVPNPVRDLAESLSRIYRNACPRFSEITVRDFPKHAIIWHDGVGMSLYSKRLERGKYIWPSAVDGVIAISPSQMACMLEAIDWRNPQATWRPTLAG
ncbi:IS66 family insertion sequence element accessory protein TnpB [Sphingobium sp. CR2-8]|uniref:IS66 family insertion sequence element accessory protein TnpB n=1 Tax=Sphingobium sp. CR2-8 TaxID=1306534 RepID=UPI002DB7E23B|nr:IS66 family insertion sequence element accessory protein TnpB [Sphingobium sp. CR2-8]MEC3909001.1 IS66 family insertion sequence element accessory protein TnpB [Sphingobium sp. CR2-8]